VSFRIVPLSHIDGAWRNELAATVPQSLDGMSLLVFEGGGDGRPVDVRLPEAIGTMVEGFAGGDDGIRAARRPKHSGLLEPSPYRICSVLSSK